jgi:hypothetical protein
MVRKTDSRNGHNRTGSNSFVLRTKPWCAKQIHEMDTTGQAAILSFCAPNLSGSFWYCPLTSKERRVRDRRLAACLKRENWPDGSIALLFA